MFRLKFVCPVLERVFGLVVGAAFVPVPETSMNEYSLSPTSEKTKSGVPWQIIAVKPESIAQLWAIRRND